MSGNNQEYEEQNDDSQNYDDQDQDQEYDSQEENSQNNGNEDGDNDEGNEEDDEDDDDDENAEGPKYIRLRGLPWSATHKEILDFLKGINVVGGAEGIHILTRRWDGVNSGEAYVELKGQQDAVAAMKLDNASMGHRYIEVFNASSREAKDALRKTSSHGISYVVKLRGLPFSANEQQIEEFFNGLEIKPDREGIVFVMDRRGRTTGSAFVQFESQEDTEQALGRNRQKIGHRYIEIFRSSLAELKRSTNGNGRMAPYDIRDRGSNRGNNDSDYGGNSRNNRYNGGFGVGANNILGFSNLPFGNNGNFGNKSGGGNFGNFGNSGGGGGGNGGPGNFGNNNGGNFGNFGNNNGNNFASNSGGGNMGSGGGFNRFSGNSGNFGNDFGDFGNFGNNRSNNNNMANSGGGNNMGSGSGYNNFTNFGNGGGGGSGFGNNMGAGGGLGNGGGNFGPIGGGRNDDLYMIMLRGLPFSSFENDVYKFFEPLRPVNARIHYNKQNGRHNGTAEALFDSYDDAQLAMKRHGSKMGQRYIELFFNGKSKSGKGGGNNYSTGGNMGSGIGNGNNSIGVGGGMSGGNMFSRRI